MTVARKPAVTIGARWSKIPRLDHSLVGKVSEQDRQIRNWMTILAESTNPTDVMWVLVTLAKSTDRTRVPFFPKGLVRLVTASVSVDAAAAVLDLRAEEVDILLRTWGIPPSASRTLADRVRRTLPTLGTLSLSESRRRGDIPRRQFLKLNENELIVQNGEELAQVLKRALEKAKLTPTEMAKKTGISRSQVYYLIGSNSLPRKRRQIESFLYACRLHPEQAQMVLDQWQALDRRRGEPALSEPDKAKPTPSTSPDHSSLTEVVSLPSESPKTSPEGTEESTKTIRVDGPDGRSITLTGPQDDTDQQRFAEMVIKLSSDRGATWLQKRLPVMTMLGMVGLICQVAGLLPSLGVTAVLLSVTTAAAAVTISSPGFHIRARERASTRVKLLRNLSTKRREIAPTSTS